MGCSDEKDNPAGGQLRRLLLPIDEMATFTNFSRKAPAETRGRSSEER
jgi:hypothetical protein